MDITGQSRTAGASSPILVFDIGGTTCRAGLYDPVRECLLRSTALSADEARRPGGTAKQQLARFASCLDALADQVVDRPREIRGVVVGFPGPVTADGIVLAAPTLWPGTDLPPLALGQYLERRWAGTPVLVINELTAAGFAYALTRRSTFCVVTVSSGVGHKVFVDGRPLLGAGGEGGEIGHVVVDRLATAPPCDCGGRGHLAAIASGRGTLRLARSRATVDHAAFAASAVGRTTGGKVAALTNELLAECFRDGDAWASDVIQTGADQLGWMLAVLRSGVGVDEFVLVGGFAQALGPRYCAEVAKAMDESSWSLRPDRPASIELGDLGDAAGLLGAGSYASTALGPTVPRRASARRTRAAAQGVGRRQAVGSGPDAA